MRSATGEVVHVGGPKPQALLVILLADGPVGPPSRRSSSWNWSPRDGGGTAVLDPRLHGDDVPAFDATYRCDHRPGFKVVVDPAGDLLTLDPVRDRS